MITGMCVGGPNDGQALSHDKPERKMYTVIDKEKGPDGRYISVTFELVGMYVNEGGIWNWRPKQ